MLARKLSLFFRFTFTHCKRGEEENLSDQPALTRLSIRAALQYQANSCFQPSLLQTVPRMYYACIHGESEDEVDSSAVT